MRYHRQELIIGKKGQSKLSNAKVAVVGLGAIGSVSSELLARAGIGQIVLIDRDIVELTNLQRQMLYTEKDIDAPKAVAMKKHLKEINSEISITPKPIDLNFKTINELANVDVILDGTDNLYTRFLINEFCKKNSIPWIYAGAIKHYSNLQVILPITTTPCFRCVFQETAWLETCDTAGILNTTSTLIASLQVTEALKILLGKPALDGLLSYDVWNQCLSKVTVKKNTDCPVCKGIYEYLDGRMEQECLQFCGGSHYQFFIPQKEYSKAIKRLKNHTPKQFEYGIVFGNIILFKDGRVLVKAKNLEHAKSLMSRYLGQ